MSVPERAAGSTPHGVSNGRWRVLFVITSSDLGGTESFLLQLATRLDRDRFSARVCSLCPRGSVAEQISASGIPVFSLQMSPGARMRELPVGARRIATEIDRSSIDVVHSLLYRANVLSSLGSRLARRRPVMVTGQRSLTPLSGRLAEIAARWTRRWSDRVVAVSEAVREELLAEGCEPERIAVITNGVDTARFRVSSRAAARSRLGIDPEAFVVGAVGRLSPKKGFETLLRAVAEARSHRVFVNLVLVGDGPERDRLEREVRRLGLEGCVRFLGTRRDLERIYPAFDAFALPSLEEGSPNALLEAMACGRAVVATAVGGVPEILGETCGLLVEPAAPSRLADALSRLARGRGLREALGAAARRRIEDRFEVGRMVERHEQLYLSLLACRSGAPGLDP